MICINRPTKTIELHTDKVELHSLGEIAEDLNIKDIKLYLHKDGSITGNLIPYSQEELAYTATSK